LQARSERDHAVDARRHLLLRRRVGILQIEAAGREAQTAGGGQSHRAMLGTTHGWSLRSVGDARGDRPHAWNGVATKVEAAVGGGRLRRPETASVRAEKVDLGIVAAVVRPDCEVTTRYCEIDAVSKEAANRGRVQRVARRKLAQLDERPVLDPVLEDALRPRVEAGRQLSRITVRQQLALVFFRIAGDARVLRAGR